MEGGAMRRDSYSRRSVTPFMQLPPPQTTMCSYTIFRMEVSMVHDRVVNNFRNACGLDAQQLLWGEQQLARGDALLSNGNFLPIRQLVALPRPIPIAYRCLHLLVLVTAASHSAYALL
eukprot:CAMPEP_0177778924 /NCGR_PEP_ID=MMETSP0491_2-20121128/16250_1 /TAXON_ID=63592 /ORGANISM="Tetraselmis chuii, Strain PLY429" /LENGTH=117 /DNA_ID=CAMNT_0019298303 /DNA_START=1 /DNA_END=354 /DNA_ORIENTATION=+